MGMSKPGKPLFYDNYLSWIGQNKHGQMSWLKKRAVLRKNPNNLLKGCRTVISLAYPYPSEKPVTPDGFSAARFTQPREVDYHDRLRKLAKHLARHISEQYPGSKFRVCVDSAPIMERSFAYASGVGFIGKNNMLISQDYGSFLFLVEILTTASIHVGNITPLENQCGTCTSCIDACPTGALEGPFSFDASRCLSYLTVEYKDSITEETAKKMDRCFFGCDICQVVCPFNRDISREDISLPSTDQILQMGSDDFDTKLGQTPLARTGLDKIKNNIQAIRKGISS